MALGGPAALGCGVHQFLTARRYRRQVRPARLREVQERGQHSPGKPPNEIQAAVPRARLRPAKLAPAVNPWLILRPSRADSALLIPSLWQFAE
jgi:hypothetical protein